MHQPQRAAASPTNAASAVDESSCRQLCSGDRPTARQLGSLGGCCDRVKEQPAGREEHLEPVVTLVMCVERVAGREVMCRLNHIHSCLLKMF